MSKGLSQNRIQATASELARSLAHRDRQAGVHLARLLLVDESVEESAYRLFACALARQLRRWPRGVTTIDQVDVVLMLRSAAHELLAEREDSGRETVREG